MSKGIVLITGINGYIAGSTAEAFLNAGWTVRGTVRNLHSGKPTMEVFKKYADKGKLEIVQVTDIAADGAFDEAVKGVTAIAHIASPASFSFTDPDPVIRAALSGTRSILKSAHRYAGPQIKAFVLASSVAALVNEIAPPYTYTEKDWNTTDPKALEEKGKDTPGRQVYRASKALSERALWEFGESEKPSFTLTSILPAFVMGPHAVVPPSPDKINDTALPVYHILSGQPLPNNWIEPVSTYVDVRDVARLFQWSAENPETSNGERLIACAGVYNNQAIADILRKAYPDLKIVTGTPGKGYPQDFAPIPGGITIDGSKAAKFTGQAYIPFEKLVLDAAKAYEKFL